MNTSSLIALGAFGVAVLTFIATQIAARRAGIESESDRRIRRLEKEVQDCEEQKIQIERRAIDLADENITLLRRVVKQDGRDDR